MYAQNSISGTLSDENGEWLTFCSVYLSDINDSSKIITGTISDLYGKYLLQQVNQSEYLICVSGISFVTIIDTLDFAGNDTVLNFTLKPKSIDLAEVEIKSSAITHDARKTTYVVTKNSIEKSTSALNLVSIVPGLIVNELNKNISSMSNGRVKILLNGINATEHDLMAILPDEVVRIEHYRIPPVRFSDENSDCVINIITRKAIEGFDISADINQAVFTGFSDDFLAFKYNKNNLQLKLTYFFSYRNYKTRSVNEQLSYRINDTLYTLNKIGLNNSPFGYAIHDINIALYTFKEKNYVFNINIKPNLRKSFYEQNQDVELAINDKNEVYRSTEKNNYYDNISSIDIYWSKELKNKQQFITNIVGNFFNSGFDNRIIDTSTDTVVINNTSANGYKYSIISELCYSRQFSHFLLTTGIKYLHSYATYLNSGNYSLEIFTESQISNLYAYSELSGSFKKLTYSAGIGLLRNVFSEEILQNEYTFMSARPILRLNYPLSKFSNLDANYTIIPQDPSYSMLNPNMLYIDRRLYSAGNPELKSYNNSNYGITYSFYKSVIQLSSGISYNYSKDIILYYYAYNDNIILQTAKNQEWEKEYKYFANFIIRPFKKNWVSIYTIFELYLTENKIIGYPSNSLIGNKWAVFLDFDYKNWKSKIGYLNPAKTLAGQKIYTDANYSIIQLQYKIKNLTIGVSLGYPIEKSYHFSNNTVNNAIINSSLTGDILDSGRLLSFSITYSFTKGKNISDVERVIQNEDKDSGNIKPSVE
ncbi:MAG: outer membrane beta-barrel protein [Bacteroidia bacterium]|nr:outer membrane beta-barrel protein [Bacteroidia bacterium]